MISKLSVKDFAAVPYLETSTLMQNHPRGIKLSTKQPNVIVGPNGAGKSALLTALAIHTLSYTTGESAFDDHYTVSHDGEAYWSRESKWGNDYEFLKGFKVDGDLAPALYYRPGHIPGNDVGITHAMMRGYFNEAKAYAQLVENKSSGQQSQALLAKVEALLTGETTELAYGFANWSSGKAPRELNPGQHNMPWDYKAEILKKRLVADSTPAIPLVLMDEPEQSLDARAESALWQKIQNCAPGVQVIVATHSLYPMLHPNQFNLIEAVPGYVKEVRSMLGLSV